MINDGIRVTHYEELKTFLRMFRKGDLQLLILIGEGGTGKTSLLKEEMAGTKHFFANSHITPLQLYQQAYQHRNEPILLEDVGQLLTSQVAVGLLKQLAETRRIKEVQYWTTSSRLTVPPAFKTLSRILISCNRLQAEDQNFKALISRGLLIEFKPTKGELIGKMREILCKIDLVKLEKAQRQKVLRFIEANAEFAVKFNLRILVLGLQFFSYSLTEPNFGWKDKLLALMGVDLRLKEVLLLMSSGKPTKQQIECFSGGRTTYFKYKKKVRQFKSSSKIRKEKK